MSQSSQSSQSSVIKNFTEWTSENEIIDDFIQETQLNVDEYDNVLFEWILYNQFNVKEISKSDSTPIKTYTIIIYPSQQTRYERLYHGFNIVKNIVNNAQFSIDKRDDKIFEWIPYDRFNGVKEINDGMDEKSDERINLKCLPYLANETEIYGISQNPDTKDYVMVLKKE
ncbi:hypothetical protein RhiirC2_789123 [Rhizophagus irregularis]|uniref:Uncharacterized protein n=1 Tax=Rhizophagus irregularis TaxID=588596 RepID=A0A2N1MNR6_9GLOM|nr:hypothetical protein RhiirC2_789123 [Rhizophagus irregularis]